MPAATVVALSPEVRAALAAGEHSHPHQVLGAHPATHQGREGAVVRAFHPDAVAACCLLPEGGEHDLAALGDGAFGAFIPGKTPPFAYRLRFQFVEGGSWERDDPYRFLPTLGDLDLHLSGEGTHRRLWERLGAHPLTVDGVDGVAFAVWAPNARRVSVVGDFCRWDGRLFPMRSLGSSGVFELFVPHVALGALYKFEIKTREGLPRIKADPYALEMEHPPGTASKVSSSDYVWTDDDWMAIREQRDVTREPVAIYEVHLGSWARVPEEGTAGSPIGSSPPSWSPT